MTKRTSKAASTASTAAILAEKFMVSLGIVCLHGDAPAAADAHTKLTVQTFAAHRIPGEKVWFRSIRDLVKVRKEIAASSRYAYVGNDYVLIKQPPAVTVDLIRTCAQLVGVSPLLEQDVITTAASVTELVEKALVQMKRDGTMKRLHAEWLGADKLAASGERKAANRAAWSAVNEAYEALDKDGRHRVKEAFKSAKLVTPKLSWSRHLEAQLGQAITIPGTSGTVGTSASPSIVPANCPAPTLGTSDTGQFRDIRDNGDKTVSSYGKWLVERLGGELVRLNHSGAFTTL